MIYSLRIFPAPYLVYYIYTHVYIRFEGGGGVGCVWVCVGVLVNGISHMCLHSLMYLMTTFVIMLTSHCSSNNRASLWSLNTMESPHLLSRPVIDILLLINRFFNFYLFIFQWWLNQSNHRNPLEPLMVSTCHRTTWYENSWKSQENVTQNLHLLFTITISKCQRD